MKGVRNKVLLKKMLVKLSGTDQQIQWLEQLFHQEQVQELWMAYNEKEKHKQAQKSPIRKITKVKTKIKGETMENKEKVVAFCFQDKMLQFT